MKKWAGVKMPLIRLILLSFLFSFISIQSAHSVDCATTTFSAGSTRYVKITSAAGCTWLIPSGVTSLDFVLVGGGGGGSGGGSSSGINLGGGGGGAGGVVRIYTSYAVVGNNNLTLTVGSGGSGSAVITAASPGTSTTLTYSGTTITATGGGGGTQAGLGNNNTQLSGDGGSNADYSGGVNEWDGGGGGAGAAAIGNNGIDIGGQGGTGGVGGNGKTDATINTIAAATSSGELVSGNYYFGGGGGGGSTPNGSGNPPAGANTGVGALGGYGGGGYGGFQTNGAQASAALTNTGGGGGGGGWKSDSVNADRAGKNGADGIILIRYTAVADTTPPTFTSSNSFSVAENIATSATAATIRVSESATVTISSGVDAARFNISRSDTDTAIIKFNVSPDYEAPIDSGGDNIYNLTLTATDTAGNAGTQAITITVTNVVDTSAFSLFQLAGGATIATYRSSIVITATVTVASKISFNSNGKVVPGCKNKLATGSGSSFTATCTWRPSNRGAVNLTAAATPTGAGITGTSAEPISIRVGNRTTSR
jgi:hypothetical protein